MMNMKIAAETVRNALVIVKNVYFRAKIVCLVIPVIIGN